MKILICVFSFLLLNCISARVDWDSYIKPGSRVAYTHPHDGNLTKAEVKNNPSSKNANAASGNELYRIKGQEELNPPMAENCFTKVSHCISSCSTTHDPSETIWAFKSAIIKSKRGFCIDSCYDELGPICNNFKRITRY